MTPCRVPIVLPFDHLARGTLRGRDREGRYVVRDRFETLVPVHDERDGTLVLLGRHGRPDLALPIVDGRAYRPVCGISAQNHRAPADVGPVAPDACAGFATAAAEQGKNFEWARPGMSAVRLATDGHGRPPGEIVTKAFWDRRVVETAREDRDARLAAAIEEASHLAVFDGGLHTSLRVPVVEEADRAVFLDLDDPWDSRPEIRESHSLATVLASSGRAGLAAAGFAGDVHLVEPGFDDLLLGFDILASRIMKRTHDAVAISSDETFSLHGKALAAVRQRRTEGGAGPAGLGTLVACAEAMTLDGVSWGTETGGSSTPKLAARLRLHHLRGTAEERSGDAWAEGFEL